MLVMDDLDLIGIDYLWEIALKGSERIVGRAVNLLKQSYTNLGPRLRANQVRTLVFSEERAWEQG
jgi:ubiquitin carboxyl-terminal hydrolase 9/24